MWEAIETWLVGSTIYTITSGRKYGQDVHGTWMEIAKRILFICSRIAAVSHAALSMTPLDTKMRWFDHDPMTKYNRGMATLYNHNSSYLMDDVHAKIMLCPLAKIFAQIW